MQCQNFYINSVYCISAKESPYNNKLSEESQSPKKEKIQKTESPELNCEIQKRLKPETCDVGVSVDMSSEAGFNSNDLNALQDVSMADSYVSFEVLKYILMLFC